MFIFLVVQYMLVLCICAHNIMCVHACVCMSVCVHACIHVQFVLCVFI